jgi:signal transduction histidine kinase/DNA-binding response OmpR family regulator
MVVLGHSVLHAQDYIVNFQSFGVEDGMLHRNIQCVFEDKTGFIWTGTPIGLQRFDGYEFKWYASPAYPYIDNVSRIGQDNAGWLWLWNNELKQYVFLKPETGAFLTTYERFKNNPQALPDSLMSRITTNYMPGIPADSTGRLYFGLKNPAALAVYDAKTGFTIHPIPGFQHVVAHFVDSHQCIWASQGPVLIKISPEGTVLNIFNHEGMTDLGHFREWNGVLSYHADNRTTVSDINWYQIDQHDQRQLISVIPKGTRYHNYINDQLWELWDNEWKVYDRSHTKLLFTLQGKDYPKRLIDHVFTLPYRDRRGRIWIYGAFGLNMIDARPNLFRQYLSFKEYESKPFNNAARGILTIGNTLLVNFEEGGLVRFNTGQPGAYNVLKSSDTHWGNARGYFGRPIWQDPGGKVWVGNQYNLEAWSADFKSQESFSWKDEPSASLDIWSIHRDAGDRLWLGAGRGLFFKRPGEQYLQQYIPKNEWAGLFAGGFPVYAMIDEPDGQFWLCSEKGLFLFDPARGEVPARYWKGAAEKWRLPADKFYHFYKDKDGIYWLATDKGLIRWDKGAGNSLLYTKADGLSNDVIYAIYPDGHDHLWLSSDYGIMRFDKLTGLTKTFLVKDGISHDEFNRISHFQDNQGRIYFGGLNGVTSFNPDDFQETNDLPDPPLVILSFQQFDGAENRLADKTASLQQTSEIVLQPNDRYFQLEFALLSIQDAKQNRYAYQIKGIHDDWQYQSEKTLRFGRLPYGKYELHIKAQDATGRWSSRELVIIIDIRRPFYLQMWFLVLAGLLLLSAGPAFFRWRTMNLQKIQARLEAEVALQTKTIRQQAEELREMDNMKSRFFANVSHELRTPLTLMVGPIGSALKSNQLDNHNFTLLKLALQNGQKLMQLINEILDLSKMESGKMETHEAPSNLLPLLRRLLAQFESYALEKGVELTFEYQAASKLNIQLDVEKFEIIFNNLVSNALKFTPNDGKIKVLVRDQGNMLRLQVADTGPGIHPDDLPYVFNRFFQSKQPNAPTQGGTGIGLALCWEYAQLFGGHIGVESVLGEGSVFTFEFPKKEVLGFARPEPASVFEPEILTQPLAALPIPKSVQAQNCILLVEDNIDLRQYIQLVLGESYEVLAAENGQEALQILEGRLEKTGSRRRPVHLIVSDIMMPVMDGFQLLDNIKHNPQYCHIPVIMLTARADMRDRLRALRIGVDDYLLKPFDEEELLARIESLLKNQKERFSAHMGGQAEERDIEPEVIEPRTTLTLEDQQWLAELERIVLSHINQYTLSADFIADKLALSRRQFFRRIKVLTGNTPNEYINEVRYSRARQLLEDRVFRTVKEVSYAVGMRDPLYFSQQFRERFGKQPSSYFS